MRKNIKFNKNILLGIVLVILGVGLLSFTAFRLPVFHAFWPAMLIALGGFFIWRVFYLGESEILLFLGMLFVQSGLLGLLNGWFSFIDIERIWPIFLTMVGITLVPYGFRKRRSNRAIFMIPAVTFIFLSFIFLPFSLNLTKMGFRDFVYRWWPLLFVFLGILLLANHIGRNITEKREHPDRNK